MKFKLVGEMGRVPRETKDGGKEMAGELIQAMRWRENEPRETERFASWRRREDFEKGKRRENWARDEMAGKVMASVEVAGAKEMTRFVSEIVTNYVIWKDGGKRYLCGLAQEAFLSANGSRKRGRF